MISCERDTLSAPGPEPPLRLGVVQLDGIPWARTADHLWYPVEPLLDEPRRAGELPELSAGYLFAEHAYQVFLQLHEMCTTASVAVLTQVLEFLKRHEADIVVFPEYLVPPSFLPKLVEFSADRVVVAGLGLIRSIEDAADFANAVGHSTPKDLVDRNIAVLITKGRQPVVVTKERLAYGEAATEGGEGKGVIVKQVTLRGRQINVGVAVCKDYLESEKQLRDQGAEIVCVPAYTRNYQPFEPDRPRDYVRMLANTAKHGGTQIILPLDDGHLTDRDGVRPLPAGRQGIVLVEYRDYPRVPTPIRAARNRLLLRAEIIERTPANAATLNAIDELAKPFEGTTRQRATRIKELLKQVDSAGLVAEAFTVCQKALFQGFDGGQEILDLATTHLPIDEGYSPRSIRQAQVEHIVAALQQLINNPEVMGVGAALDHYRKISESYQLIRAAAAARIHSSEERDTYTYQTNNVGDGARTERVGFSTTIVGSPGANPEDV
jgi:hypothetical protein